MPGSILQLNRLISLKTVEELFDSFFPLFEGRWTALYDREGNVFLSRGKGFTPASAADLAKARTAACREGENPLAGDRSSWYPVYDGRELAALLEGQGPVQVMLALQSSIQALVTSGGEKRQLARETLDRYREVNLLYRVAEMISVKLEVQEIVPTILGEAQHAIQAICAVAVLWGNPENGGRQVIGLGEERSVEAAAQALESLGEQANLSPVPMIWLDPPGWHGDLLYAPMMARNTIFGVIGLLRPSGQPEFQSGEEKLLTALASQAGFAIDKAILHQKELQRERVEQELRISERIQRSLLPREMPNLPGWEFASTYQSANQIGGDFFDVFRLALPPEAGPAWGLMVADVTGKGIPAALMMAFSHAILQAAVFVHKRPGEILFHANQLITSHSRSGLLLTVFYAIFQPETGQVWFANGGHEPPIWYRAAARDCVELDRGASLLVGARRSTLFPEQTITLARGDVLVLYTDGVTEARSPSGDFFTVERLQEIITSWGELTAEGLLQVILEEIRSFTGDYPQADDITVFVVKRSS